MVSESIGRSRGRERPIGLSTLRHDGPAEHHRVIFVGEVVAVRDVRAGERPEVAIDVRAVLAAGRARDQRDVGRLAVTFAT